MIGPSSRSSGVEVVLRPTSVSGGDDGNFTDLITSLNAADGGTIKLVRGTAYSFDAAVTMQPKVAIEGQGFRVDRSYNVLDGTIIQGNGTTAGFVYNNTALGGQPATIPDVLDEKLSGLRLKNIAFDNFTRALHFGDRYNTGIFEAVIEDLIATNCTQWGFYLENFSLSHFQNLKVAKMASGATGCMMFRASTTAYNHGNCSVVNLYAQADQANVRGICIHAVDGAKLNDFNVYRVQCNTGSSGKASQAATMSNGSANITVTNGAALTVDMPVSVSATANGFNQWQTYFVVSQSGNVIQLSNLMRGTAISATGSTAVNIDTWGWPSIEIVAHDDNATALIQQCVISGIDAEGYATAQIVSQNAQAHLDINYTPYTQGTDNASSVVFRDSYGSYRFAGNFTIDINSGSRSNFCVGGTLLTTQSKAAVQHAPLGMFRDETLNQIVWKLDTTISSNTKTFQAQYLTGGNFIYPATAIGQRAVNNSSTSLTMTAAHTGCIVYTGTAAATWTLPVLTDVAGGSSNSAMAGLVYEICNGSTDAGAPAVTLNAGTGDTFNRNSAKTSYSIPQYSSISIRANFDGTAGFWQVLGNNGAT